MRADQLLVERGLAATRSQAQRLIAAGVQWRLSGGDWKAITKNGDELREAAELRLLDTAETRYVSRGGLKLEGALRHTGLAVTGLRGLDVGQSSGGFTDCLLQHGATQVVGVDVGQGQLHPKLKGDPRVLCIEKCNARELSTDALQAAGGAPPFDLIVGDLSFISQTLVWPAVVPLLAPGGHWLMLVKPQFELQPAQIGKGGLVKDAASYAMVRERIEQACVEHGLRMRDYFESPITGGDGNREFFVYASK
jgi:23S rRNA (cytidine1920-2'-O)/16S rRNA (cytidine1409-2'-O)-methyltransferase